MARYDYQCLECEKVFEVEQKFADDPLEECLCEGEKFLVKRQHPDRSQGFYLSYFCFKFKLTLGK